MSRSKIPRPKGLGLRMELTDSLSPEPTGVEEARIRTAHAKRQGNDIRYSWFSPGHLFIMQERERRLLTLLQRHGFDFLDTYNPRSRGLNAPTVILC